VGCKKLRGKKPKDALVITADGMIDFVDLLF